MPDKQQLLRCVSHAIPLFRINYDSVDRFKPDVIEERKKSCVEILQAASSLHHLAKSDTLIEFLQVCK